MVFDIQEIYVLVMAMLPTLTTIITQVIGFARIFNNKAEFETMKKQFTLLMKENLTLKKQVNELLTKIDHIDRGE